MAGMSATLGWYKGVRLLNEAKEDPVGLRGLPVLIVGSKYHVLY